jgi:hypothetical protein
MALRDDIEEAIHWHGAWKANFRNFLSGKAALDVSTIAQFDACHLGKWLEDEGRRLLTPEDHAEVRALHAQFHFVAGEIVSNIKQKDYAAARRALASGGSFDRASRTLAAFLRKASSHGSPKGDAEGASGEPPPEPMPDAGDAPE